MCNTAQEQSRWLATLRSYKSPPQHQEPYLAVSGPGGVAVNPEAALRRQEAGQDGRRHVADIRLVHRLAARPYAPSARQIVLQRTQPA